MGAPDDALVQGVLAGHVRAAARLMRLIDDRPAEAAPALAALYPHSGRALLVGVTGNPGAGKSTLVAKLVGHYRRAGKRVGVVAVDPSSPFSGGAILGDRVRMIEHATDPGVFIRSVASRGALGGITRSTEDIALVLDAMGHDVVIVETIGVGQAEVDIVRLAHTVAVVMTPGYGDDVQALKAGLLEIADVYVVNKADLPGAAALARQLQALWRLAPGHGPSDWRPPVVETVAVEDRGLTELVATFEAHRAHLATAPGGRERLLERTEHLLLRRVEEALRRRLESSALAPERRRALAEAIAERRSDPYTTAERLVEALTGGG